MITDMEQPTSPSDYESGFFSVDATSLTAGQINKWLEPGDSYFRTVNNMNANYSIPTSIEISTAKTAWNALTRCQRWGIRLHHEAIIKRKHPTLDVWIYYHTGIPTAKKAQIDTCADSTQLEFLGSIFSEARTTVVTAKSVAFWTKFWPNNTTMDLVVVGHEGDSA